MARSRKVSRKKRSAKRETSRKVSKRCPPGCVKKPMLLTDNGKIILGSTRAAKPKRKMSRKVSRKRRSVKRKVSRKKRSVKRKVSRKRRSVKRKASRKVSRKRRSVKRKASRKRKSAKRKASRKRKSAKRKASRKKTRNSPPSGVIKKQNLGVGSVMVGQDGKTMYKVVEITMRGKPVKKWAKMKFKMGLMCSKHKDTDECDFKKPKNPITENIEILTENIKNTVSQIAVVEKQIAEKHEEAKKKLVKQKEYEKAKKISQAKKNKDAIMEILKEKLSLKRRLKKQENILENSRKTLQALFELQNDRISQILGGQ